MNKNRQLLVELLKTMEEFAVFKGIECPPIYLLGGSGCIIAGYIDRATVDIDFLDIGYSSKTGMLFNILGERDILDIAFTTIPASYAERVIRLNEFEHLEIQESF